MPITRCLIAGTLTLFACAGWADEVASLRQQISDLRIELHQRDQRNSIWLLEAQIRELQSMLSRQEQRILRLEATLARAQMTPDRLDGNADRPSAEAKDRLDAADGLRALCERTEWGEAVPAVLCKRLGIEQAPLGTRLAEPED